jgi:beta-lactamase class A
MPDTFSNLLRCLAGSCAALALAASTCAAAADPGVARDLDDRSDPALQRGLESVVRDLGLASEVDAKHLALALVDLTDASSPRLAMLNGNEMMYAASLPKVAIVFGAFAEVESGRLVLDETHIEAMTNMIRYSSNEDASRVLAWVGPERLLEILQSDRYRFYDAAG